jgi:hypothetical protein
MGMRSLVAGPVSQSPRAGPLNLRELRPDGPYNPLEWNHSSVPVVPHKGDLPPHVDYELRDSMQSLLNRFTRFGFAVLDFDEGHISVKYVSELGGAPHHTEVIA